MNGSWRRKIRAKRHWSRGKGKPQKAGKMVLLILLFFVLGKALIIAVDGKTLDSTFWQKEGTVLFSHLWNRLYPAPVWEGEEGNGWNTETAKVSERMEQVRKLTQKEADPAYRTAKAAEAFFQEHAYLEIYGSEETGGLPGETGADTWEMAGAGSAAGSKDNGGLPDKAGTESKGSDESSLAASGTAYPGRLFSLAQLEDYDFLMKHFYSVHTSTTAERELMDVKKMLSRDFRLEKINTGGEETDEAPGDKNEPQILIYHTHSQEAFADSQPGETIVAVGTYLTQCLTEKGFTVFHDTTAYDVRDGKMDRNKAYSYALEGLTEILEEYPSIEVVIDLHRDGVGTNTHLVSEINGKPTAQIMFFNGMSQTPDGPIPYLENPYREDNLSFSFQLQLKAAAWYPGFTRKIYLKGLRYNLHLRPRSCLVEVGAQTNTYQEALNAMEPLADIFHMVLHGN